VMKLPRARTVSVKPMTLVTSPRRNDGVEATRVAPRDTAHNAGKPQNGFPTSPTAANCTSGTSMNNVLAFTIERPVQRLHVGECAAEFA